MVWTGEKDVEVMSIVMKPQQWTPPGSVFSPREAALSSFPGGSVVKNPPAAAGDEGLTPGQGRSHMLRST